MMKRILVLMVLALWGVVSATAQTDSTTLNTTETQVPVLSLSSSDFEGDDISHDISGLLQGSRDVFQSVAGYNLGSARFQIRGYESESNLVMINGVPVNDPETGRVFWSVWGGLNDATRNTVNTVGLAPVRENFGMIGGSTNIQLRASEYRPGTRLTYSAANRSYNHRAMFIHSTGLVDNKWALTVSGSKRWAQEGYVDGTFYDAYAYFIAAERKLSADHSVSFTVFGSPSKSGRPGVGTQEAYDLTGNNFYNPYWGYQNGEVRNSRVNTYHQPMMLLSHYWTISEQTKVTSTLTYSLGKNGSTALNWYDAADPRPDYYRNLPSYYADTDESQFNRLTDLWQNDEEFRQLNWDNFYFANSKNLYSVKDANGTGEILTGNRAKYVVEDRRTDFNRFMVSSNAIHNLNDNIVLSGGINVDVFRGRQYKEMNDLLGADFWVDVDQFAERDFDDTNLSQNDLNNPNRIVKVGDKFGYDFTANINKYNAFAQSEFTYSRFDFHVAANVSQTSFWRTGHMRNGRFPDNSYGDSEKQNFTNFGVKGGAVWKVTGRHYIDVNAGYLTRAPFFRNSYLSSRVRDNVIDGLTSEKITTGDISYILRAPKLKARVSLYYTQFEDQTWSRSFYHDVLRTFVNYTMTGVNTRNAGLEFGLEANVTPTLSVTAAGAMGQYIYTNRPEATIARDNNSEIISDRVVYLKNYRIGGTPQTAASVGFRYNSPKYWFAGANFNYYADNYMDINPDRRTVEAADGFVQEDALFMQLIDQPKLDPAYTIDVFVGKSWRIYGKTLAVNLGVNNILNDKDIQITGFEQLRYDSQDIDKFPSKYFYMYGTNFFLNVNFSF
ncbi:MAG: TonB-dependent receptor plug domain-containing protein [Bacteroidales bacterium]|nr:TonB-dependent receptor plug domain-containing protein [Bacteroidales bacterium]MBN2749675.1 TonB-dependent receptor plug domain-containing protein [Bacteroidales bacterium]